MLQMQIILMVLYMMADLIMHTMNLVGMEDLFHIQLILIYCGVLILKIYGLVLWQFHMIVKWA